MFSKSLIDLYDLDSDDLESLINLALKIKESPKEYMDRCHGKIMATLFYEPSTRTQMSFKTAMLRLGGQVIGFDDPKNSSVAKGESLRDTVKIFANYADIIVMRNPIEGAAFAASQYIDVPIINAGDGGHMHPTQTLTDVVTLKSELGRLHNLKIGLCGDMLNSRTVHSLIKTMSRYEDNCFYLISAKELELPEYVLDFMREHKVEFKTFDNIEDCIPDLDVLYMTRIQRERFDKEEDYQRQKGIFILTVDKMKKAKEDMIIMHPLPKVDEIDVEVDDDKRAKYFEQARYGLFARMALIIKMLESDNKSTAQYDLSDSLCKNPKCITQTETYLKPYVSTVGENKYCAYCDTKIN
ncbi:MAG: aspartate carbamoyltransferase [Clostridia bacterium]|nr:aspartate carbamoyltransferase [Clostridia bacterium]